VDIGERDHRLGELRIVLAEFPALDCQRFREPTLRSFRIVADVLMEDAEPIEPIREREIILFRTARACAKNSSAFKVSFSMAS
jgi:hypothetical protein